MEPMTDLKGFLEDLDSKAATADRVRDSLVDTLQSNFDGSDMLGVLMGVCQFTAVTLAQTTTEEDEWLKQISVFIDVLREMQSRKSETDGVE